MVAKGGEVTGERKKVGEPILNRQRKATGLALIQDDSGQRVTYTALRSRFEKARELAGANFQFRDIRAKSATDAGDLQYAQKLLGHKHQTMTQYYTRDRKGEKVTKPKESIRTDLGIANFEFPSSPALLPKGEGSFFPLSH